MRRSLLQRKVANIFFCTTRTRKKARVRVLTGHYHIRWYHKGPELMHHPGKADYWLAADEVRFLDRGFPLSDLTGYLRGVRLDRRFRRFLYLDQGTSIRLLGLVKDAPDKTPEYLREIQRLEAENLQNHGFAYPNWKKKGGFNWNWARKYLGAKHDS